MVSAIETIATQEAEAPALSITARGTGIVSYRAKTDPAGKRGFATSLFTSAYSSFLPRELTRSKPSILSAPRLLSW